MLIFAFIPHGHCYLWKPELVWLHLLSDSLIALAYYSIPLTLIYFVRQRRDLPFNWIFLLFSAFIVACGTTHVMEVWTLWHPTYWLAGALKAVTAVVSLYTASALVPLVPQALALPSPGQLEVTNQALQSEIGERQQAEAALKRAYEELEAKVVSRTAELGKAKDELELRVAERTAELIHTNEQLQQELEERKQIEEALRISQTRFSGILEIADDAIISVDASQRILLFNRGAEKIFGYAVQDVLGQPLDLLIPLRFIGAHRQHVRDFSQLGGAARRMGDRRQIFGRRQDGSEFPAEASISQLNLGVEKVFTVILRDVSEQKQAEVALRESEGRLKAILDNAPAVIYLKDTHGRYLLCNPRCQAIFKANHEQWLGKTDQELFSPQFADAIRHNDLAVLRQETPMEIEEVIEQPDGLHTYLSVKFPLIDSAGEVYGICGISTDISDRKQAEQSLERLSRQLELILNSVGEGLCGLDTQGQITFVNPAAAKLLDYPAADLIGQSVRTILPATQPNGTPYVLEDSPIGSALREGVVPRLTQELFRRRDGTVISVEYGSTPIVEQNIIVGAVVAFRDITERQVVERMKDEFISVVSHELRTPLTSIHGSLGMLASGLLEGEPETSKRLLTIAAESTERLVRLINDILDIERIESGRVTMVRQICDAAELLAQAAATMQGMADRFGVSLAVTATPLSLWADPDRILQTLTNLLSNAIKFSPPGATIELSAQPQEGQVHFQVQDRGRGIPADKLETIFERFQQVDASDSRNHEGTGLGLAICRSIVQQHGGQIGVESTLGVGSRFYFTLPLQPDFPT